MKKSIINLPPDDVFTEVRRVYVKICGGSIPMAMILRVLHLYSDRQNTEWVSLSREEISERCQGGICAKNVTLHMRNLTKLGYLETRSESGSKSQYRLCASTIQQAIDSLENAPAEGQLFDVLEVGTREELPWSEGGNQGRSSLVPGKNFPGLYKEEGNNKEIAIKETNLPLLSPEVAITTNTTNETVGYNSSVDKLDILKDLLSEYARLPEKSKHPNFRGSASKLVSKAGDILMPAITELGEQALPAFRSFLQDEYWKTQKFPLYGFAKQYQSYAPDAPPRKSYKAPKGQETTSQEPPSTPAVARIEPYSPGNGVWCVRRKTEALDILQRSGSLLAALARQEMAGPAESLDPELIERWHSQAVKAFEEKFGRKAPVLTKPLCEVSA